MLIGLGRAEDSVENFSAALQLNPNDVEAWYQRGQQLLDLGRNEEAAADLAQALALKPDHAEARFAACFAELPVVYAHESEIARRRAAYEQKLAALRDDIEAGRLQGDLMKAIAARQPFLLAYQGGNDRALQEIYGGIVSRIVARHFAAGATAAPPAPRRADPRRHRQRFLLPPFQLEDPDQGLAQPARPQPLPRDRLSPRRHPRRGHRPRPPNACATASCIARSTPRAGGGKSSPTTRMC